MIVLHLLVVIGIVDVFAVVVAAAAPCVATIMFKCVAVVNCYQAVVVIGIVAIVAFVMSYVAIVQLFTIVLPFSRDIADKQTRFLWIVLRLLTIFQRSFKDFLEVFRVFSFLRRNP